MTKTKVGTAKGFMSRASYMSLDDQQEHSLLYSTREHGNVLHEQPGAEDIAHARKMRNILSKSEIDSDIETVDEWVLLTIKID